MYQRKKCLHFVLGESNQNKIILFMLGVLMMSKFVKGMDLSTLLEVEMWSEIL